MHQVPDNFEIIDDERVAILRAMTGAERLAMVDRMLADFRRKLSLQLATEHPDWTPEQVQREVAHRISLGFD